MAEKLHDAVDTYTEGWVCDAVRIAAEANAHSWRYVEAILERWKREGKDNGRGAAERATGRGPPTSGGTGQGSGSDVRERNAATRRRLESRGKAAKRSRPVHVRVWEGVLESLRLELPGGTFVECLRGTVALGVEGGALVVVVANARVKEVLERRLQERVEAALRGVVQEVVAGITGVQAGGGGRLKVDRVEWRVRET